MSISKDLFLAILSMDAYNRGYGAGIADGGVGRRTPMATISMALARPGIKSATQQF